MIGRGACQEYNPFGQRGLHPSSRFQLRECCSTVLRASKCRQGPPVSAEAPENGGNRFEEKYPHLPEELEACFTEGGHQTASVRATLGRVHNAE